MGKFIIHGTLVEEPVRTPLSNGTDCVTLIIEEKFNTAFKEIVEVFDVSFVGKNTNCVPTNIRLAGAPVVVTGTISSREYKGKYYKDLRGDTLSIITTNAFAKESTPTQEVVDEVKDLSFDTSNLADDDLPF